MAKSKMPPRSQAPLVARPPPPSQAIPPRPDSPSMDDSFSSSAAAAAAKKKKKKGKGKKADDDLDDATFHTPALSTAPFSATAKAQADLLATASDLYRRIEADPQGIPDDDAYWTSLPAHLRTFIRNALPIGQLPNANQGDSDDPASRQASTQAMIAVAQQLAQAAHASQRQLQQHPPSNNNANLQNGNSNAAYPPFPFDPSVFADLAMQTEQALPLHPHPNSNGNNGGFHYSDHGNPPPTQPPGEPLPAPVVMVNEFEDEQGDFEDSYYSDEELDQQEVAAIQSRDGYNDSHDGAAINGLTTKSSTGAAKKKNKKKKKKGGTDTIASATVDPAPTPTPLAPPTNPTRNSVTSNQQAPLRSSATNGPPPSSRAAGKQPMTFNASSGKAPANTRPSMNGVGHNHNHGPITNSLGKRPASTAASSHGQGSVNGGTTGQSVNRAWSSSSAEERESIKEFWLGLNERERRNLIKIEKDGVLRKMKEQQKHNCSCAVCGRKRSSIEDELEVLYDAYYDELEQYANHQQKHVESGGQVPPPPGPGPFPGSVALDSNGAVIGANGVTKPPTAPTPTGNKKVPHQHLHPPPPVSRTKAILPPEDDDAYDEDLEDDEYEDEYEYEDEDEDEEELDEPDVKSNQRRRNDVIPPARNGTKAATTTNDVLNFGSSLTVKGGILTVADDLLKNDGQKFLEMMEQLAERRALREEEVQAELDNGSEEGDVDTGDADDDEVEAEEDVLTDEQRMEEGRRMFQIFAARMFEQRVLQAYREKVAQERQLQLLRELEEEDMAEKEKEAKKAKENQKKKDKKRQAKQQKEEERIKLEEAKAAEEAAARAKVERQREAELKKQEDLRLRREAEKRQKDEEKARKDEEKRKKQEEERAKEMEKERKKREREDKIRLERETKEREAREVKEAKERKEEEERLAMELAIAEKEKIRKEELQQQQKEREAASSTPTSPNAAKNQSNKSTSSIPTGPSSSMPLGRKADTPSSPLQSRNAQKVMGVARPVAAPLTQSINPSTSISSLPAPPQGLPARPNTVSHAQQASLSIPSGVANNATTTTTTTSATTPASLPKAPMQSIGPINSTTATSIGSPARQATPSNAAPSSSSVASSSQAKTIVSPPLSFASNSNSAQSNSVNYPKSNTGLPSQSQVTQPVGRYPSTPFATNTTGTPTRSPPSNGAYLAGIGKGAPFESVLGSPTSVNAAIGGLGNLNLGGSSQQQMPIGPIGGGLPNSSNLLNSPHARTTSIGGLASMEEYGIRQGVSSNANPSRSISRSAAPGPIGPIGRRRDPSSMDEFGGSIPNQSINNTSSSIFGNSNSMAPLPEKILGSSALGGDDELVEPQPRRTSHHTAPISNSSSLFGSGAFGVASPWASSFASSNSNAGPIGGVVGVGGSSSVSNNSGMPRTPSTPSATSRLQSTLGTGLTSPTGNLATATNGPSGGSNAFGSLHRQSSIGSAPGLQSSLNSGGDPWTRAANGGWDRARYAFEQPNNQSQMGLYESQPSSQQQGIMSSGSISSSSSAHPLSPFGSGPSQQHNALRSMFGAPGSAAIGSGSSSGNHHIAPRHSNERGL